MNADPLPQLLQDARQAMMARQPRRARTLLEQAIALQPREPGLRLNLAAACRLDGDLDGALAAVDAALELEPRAFLALLTKGTLLEALGRDAQAAHAYMVALTQLPADTRLDAPTRAAVEHAWTIRDRHLAAMESALAAELGRSQLAGQSAEAERMRGFVGHLLGKRKVYHAQPALFYYPGLPSIEFHDRALFPWLAELEAATAAIQAELAAVLADRDAAGLEPYIQLEAGAPQDQWAELNRSSRWSAYHFAFYGAPYQDHRRQCPATAAMLDRLPQPAIPQRSPAALFSLLDPHTHIPPHHGAANTRLLCHLPLVVPPGCRFRVGNQTRPWRPGEAFVFDDTIEHEAWNDSDELRVVLIFDVWNPMLSAAERDLVRRAMIALDRLNDARPDQGV